MHVSIDVSCRDSKSFIDYVSAIEPARVITITIPERTATQKSRFEWGLQRY